jgi:Protein of unknown function (DUF1091)
VEVSTDPNLVLYNSTVHQSANLSQFSVYFNFLVDVEEASVRITARHFSKGSYVPSFFDMSVNACDFLKMKNSFPILSQIYDHLRRYGKFADRCPVKKVRKFLQYIQIFEISVFLGCLLWRKNGNSDIRISSSVAQQ